jgi:transcriptional regulator with XRE-family HTH domain
MPNGDTPTESIPPTSAVELLERLQDAGGRLHLDDPPRSARAAWRRALKADINRSYIASGDPSGRNPSLDMLARLATALQIDLGTLVRGYKTSPAGDDVSWRSR